GLKLDGQYSPLTRVGLLGMKGDLFTGTNGQKTIVSLDCHEISGWFNPLGIAFHRWQMDDLHVKWGTVVLQKTEAVPGEKPKGMPWWEIFWPYRVHLEDVKVDDACALWKLKDQDSGIYHAFLEITPNGHDFEYDARGGDFKTPLTPPLKLSHLHMLIRKPRLYCDELLLGEDATQSGGQVRISGDAGLQEDRSIKLAVDLTSLKIAPWLPENLRGHVLGHFSGHLDYASTGSSLDTASGDGHFDVADAVLHQLPPLQHYITLTGSPDPGDLPLKVCQTDVTLKEGAITAENLQIESPGVFRVRGTIEVAKDKTLSGSLTLGLTDPYLKWLPNARQTIFTQDDGDYRVTTIELSGTLEHPKEDLSPRVMAQIQKSPGTELKLFFNQAGEWFGIH
ncbi:MAG TPA: hypothetical protein VGC39_11985, partial [Candidatus Methylacidiphilales bacterium]